MDAVVPRSARDAPLADGVVSPRHPPGMMLGLETRRSIRYMRPINQRAPPKLRDGEGRVGETLFLRVGELHASQASASPSKGLYLNVMEAYAMRDSRADWRRKLDHAVATGNCPECGQHLIESASLSGKRLTCYDPACGWETISTVEPKHLRLVPT